MSTAMPTQDSAIIEIRGLSTRFGTHTVYENVNLDVYAGEILGIVGGSGTGKSVLLRTIVGLLTPVEGSIHLSGNDLLARSAQKHTQLARQFGMLFQNGALFSSMTVLENVALPLIENTQLARDDAEELATMKLALTGLPKEAIFQYPSTLSGGMVKRAALARALALDPTILFLDEPTAGLDPMSAAAFDKLILTLRDALGFTVFLVTHDLDTLYTICDRVAVLAHQKILVADTLDVVAATDDEWIKSYFHGERSRAAKQAAELCRKGR